jgi:hypothetical protein
MAVISHPSTSNQPKKILPSMPPEMAVSLESIPSPADPLSTGDLLAFFFWLGGAAILAAIILTDLIVSLLRQ